MTEQRPTDPAPVIAYARPTLAPPPPSRSAKAARTLGCVGILSILCGFGLGVRTGSSIVMLVSVIISVACSLAAIVMGLVAVIRRHHGRRTAIGGIVMGFLLVLAVGAAILIDPHPRPPMSSKAMCCLNLGSVGKMLMLYKTDNNDIPPLDLPTLALGYGSLPKCPDATKDQAGGYFYYQPSAGGNAPGSTIVACDFKRNHAGQGRAVLYAAGNVAWIGEPAFQAALALPENVEFAKALRTAEGP